MSFSPILKDNTLLGFGLQHENVFCFFGGKALSRQGLYVEFPEYDFAFLKQVHGNKVVEASNQITEADAHYSSRVTRAPVIQTADCIPLLLASRHRVCAIHAGWRSVAQNIISSTKFVFADEKVLFAAIGPHILRPSFEVGQDVANQLMSSSPSGSDTLTYPHESNPEKRWFDLTELVRRQLKFTFGSQLSIKECLFDTKTNPNFYSFRREPNQTGRQYSFVVLNG